MHALRIYCCFIGNDIAEQRVRVFEPQIHLLFFEILVLNGQAREQVDKETNKKGSPAMLRQIRDFLFSYLERFELKQQ